MKVFLVFVKKINTLIFTNILKLQIVAHVFIYSQSSYWLDVNYIHVLTRCVNLTHPFQMKKGLFEKSN